MNELIPKIRPTVPQSLKGNVLSQINKRKKLMKDIRNYSAIAAVIAAFIFVPIVLGNMTHANAIDLIEDSILETGNIKTIVITYSMRNPFTYNPDVIEMDSKMNDITGKIIFETPEKWRFYSKNKWYIFDGKCAYWHSNAYNNCLVSENIDTGDLGRFNSLFFKPTAFLETIKKVSEDKKAKLEIKDKGDSTLIYINYKVRSIDKNRFMMGNIFGWYNNKFKYSFETDCRQVYVFDKESKLLKNFYISVFYNNKYVTILKSKKIEYNVEVNKTELLYVPKELPRRLLHPERYLINMTSKKAVEKMLTDIKNDSTICKKIAENNKKYEKWYCMEILEIGESYKESGYPGEIVPCKLKLNDGEVIETKMSVRNDNEFKTWILDNKY